jgi:hypothetical protein
METPEIVTTTIETRPWVLPVAVGLVAVCAGIWIGFKVAGGSVGDLGGHEPCQGCAEKAAREAERAILNEDTQTGA